MLIIIIGIPLVLAGAFTWWILSRLGEGKRRWPAAGEAESDGAQPDEQELLRVSRMKNEKLAVLVQGRSCRHLREITDPDIARETIEAIKAVLAFAEGWLPSTHKQEAQILQPPDPQAADAPADASDSEAPEAKPASSAPSAAARAKSILHRPGRMLDPLTFVEDIDALVQQRLRALPEMASRNIHLTVGPSGGMRIYVDQHVFEAVGDVTDPQVRQIIQNAIREWEGN